MTSTLAPRTAERLVAATPASRDRYVDFLRVASLAAVVLGHWLMAAVSYRDGGWVRPTCCASTSGATC